MALEMTSRQTDTNTERLERTLASVLRPLSKIMIKNNFSVQMGIETLKRALVGSALDGTDATDSLVSLKTGVHRKDVKRLRSDIEDGSPAKFPIQGLAMVLATWTQQKPFSNGTGGGRPLARKRNGDTPGFDELIRASKVDLAAATVMNELQAQDLVTQHPDGAIELRATAFVGKTGDAALEAFEATIADHVRIATENVLTPPGEPRQFDQVLRYSHLSDASVTQLEETARAMAADYLGTLNALAHKLQSQDDASGNLLNGRFVTGVFVAPTPPVRDGQPDKVKDT